MRRRVLVVLSWLAGGAAPAVLDRVGSTAPPKVRARCSRAKLTALGAKILNANRSVVIAVQTSTPTKSNVCEGGRTDWREGLGQCLARLTGLRVYVRNYDGTCADCAELRRIDCAVVMNAPAALVVALGGGDEERNVYRCAGSYCGTPHEPFSFTVHGPPSDYVGGCALETTNVAGEQVFKGPHVATGGDLQTRFAWFPILNPLAHVRSVVESSTLFASWPETVEELHRIPRSLPDSEYLSKIVEPAFAKASLAPIQVFRDDSFPKPILMPRAEMRLYLSTGHVASLVEPRLKVLLYVGSFRESKGQLRFLEKLREATLRDYTLHFYGLRQRGHEAYFANLTKQAEKFGKKVVIHHDRVPHEELMRVLSTASGIVHMPSADRNPRVLYEALNYGLPLLVSRQSMPFVGSQCAPFVFLSDYDADARKLNADIAKFLGSISNTTAIDIRQYADRELSAQSVFSNLCARMGICAPECGIDPNAPWAGYRGEHARRLRRFETSGSSGVNRTIKAAFDIHDNPRRRHDCLARNTFQRKKPWWAYDVKGADHAGSCVEAPNSPSPHIYYDQPHQVLEEDARRKRDEREAMRRKKKLQRGKKLRRNIALTRAASA